MTERMSFFPYSSVSSRSSYTAWWPRRPTPSRSLKKLNGPCVRCTGSWGYAWGCRGPRSSGTTSRAGIGRVSTRSSRPSSSTRQWSGRRSTWTTRQVDRPYPRPFRLRDPGPGFFGGVSRDDPCYFPSRYVHVRLFVLNRKGKSKSSPKAPSPETAINQTIFFFFLDKCFYLIILQHDNLINI